MKNALVKNALIIVESPAKAKTFINCLGEFNDKSSDHEFANYNFTVLATYGHILDLKAKEKAIDIDKDFALNYQPVEKNKKHLNEIIGVLETTDVLYLATNPDREGEALAWHLHEALQSQNLLEGKVIQRIVVHELNEHAISAALKSPRDLNYHLVSAQQAQRTLDYLVTYKLSPLFWKKIRHGLAAGRMQDPALHMIVERERSIERFREKPFWIVSANLAPLKNKKQSFSATLTHYQTTTLSQFSIDNTDITDAIKTTLGIMTKGKLTVLNIEKTEITQEPSAPFTTSTLLQEASRRLGFTTMRTMRIAQQLFEGINTGDGEIGLITYHQTNNACIEPHATSEIRECIVEKYKSKSLSEQVRFSTTNLPIESISTEAIRPSFSRIIPNKIKARLTGEQYKLYDLIWKRAIASQMIHATYEDLHIDFDAVQGIFRASNSTVLSSGFMSVYPEEKNSDVNQLLPDLKIGDKVSLLDIQSEQFFTKPPSRFSEASLIQALDENKICQASNFAPTISFLENKEYIDQDNKLFYPTDVGRIIAKFLTQHFAHYVDYEFVAKLEKDLEAISIGEKDRISLLHEYWNPLKKLIEHKSESVNRDDVIQETTNEKCPKCGEALSIRLGNRGRFIGCTTYPVCDYTRNLGNVEDDNETETIEGRTCPECQSALVFKQGKYGKFVGCSAYPDCKHMEPLNSPEDSGVKCPECRKGAILKRKSRNGKTFYSCSGYPKCKYAIWNPPLDEKCPDCGWPILTTKTSRSKGIEKVCPQKGCGFSAAVQQ